MTRRKPSLPTTSGKVALNIPPYASSGDKLRLKGKGVNGGDQIITLNVVLPKEKNAALEDVIKNMSNDDIRTF